MKNFGVMLLELETCLETINMTYTFFTIFIVVWFHYFHDFVFQSHWMASNKSKCNKALSAHVGVYSIGLISIAVFCIWDYVFSYQQATMWIVLNAVMHFMTDYITSRKSSKLFGKDWHNFFEVIGADQLIHYLTLFGTMKLIADHF